MGWTIPQFARRADLSEGAVRNIDHDDWQPSGKTIKALEALVSMEFEG